MKTFKEASEELKITKQTLTSWIKELNESSNIIWENKTRYLDETLINKIKQYKNIENENKDFDKEQNLTLPDILKRENELLVKQIAKKDEQIKNLTKLIDQQQQLTISDKKENEALKNELKTILHQLDYNEVRDDYSKVKKTNNSKNESFQKKRFWSKLFGK